MTKGSESKQRLSLSVLAPAPIEYDAELGQKLFAAWESTCTPTDAGEIQVSFVTRPRMREYYRAAYGEDRPTDVLSLHYDGQPGEEAVVGEVVICPAEARAAAQRLGTDMRTELATLLVHGLLHLTGLDHQDESEQRRFHQLTHDIMGTQSLEAISLWSV